jgi:hypothetical protein
LTLSKALLALSLSEGLRHKLTFSPNIAHPCCQHLPDCRCRNLGFISDLPDGSAGRPSRTRRILASVAWLGGDPPRSRAFSSGTAQLDCLTVLVTVQYAIATSPNA